MIRQPMILSWDYSWLWYVPCLPASYLHLLSAVILIYIPAPAFDSSNWLKCLLLLLSITKLISPNRLAIFEWCRHDLAESSPVSFIIIVFLIMALCRPLLINSKYHCNLSVIIMNTNFCFLEQTHGRFYNEIVWYFTIISITRRILCISERFR